MRQSDSMCESNRSHISISVLRDCLTAADTDCNWVIHEVIVDPNMPGHRPRIVYDNMTITMTLPGLYQRATQEEIQDLMDMSVECIVNGTEERNVKPSLQRFLKSQYAIRRSRAVMEECGMIVSDEEKFSKFLEMSYKKAVKFFPRRSMLNNIKVVWRSRSALMGRKFIATTSPIARVIAIDDSVRVGLSPELVYIVFRELCTIVCYDFATDSVNMDSFKLMLTQMPGWEVAEKICMHKGWVFKYKLFETGEEERRW